MRPAMSFHKIFNCYNQNLDILKVLQISPLNYFFVIYSWNHDSVQLEVLLLLVLSVPVGAFAFAVMRIYIFLF